MFKRHWQKIYLLSTATMMAAGYIFEDPQGQRRLVLLILAFLYIAALSDDDAGDAADCDGKLCQIRYQLFFSKPIPYVAILLYCADLYPSGDFTEYSHYTAFSDKIRSTDHR